MISVLNIARNSCRGSVLQVLRSRSHVLGSTISLQKTSISTSLKCGPFFSTSHNASAAHAEHSHSFIWTVERFMSAGLIGLLPLSLAFPNPGLDYALALALTAHVHWGIEAIVVDYVRPSIVGAALSRAAVAGVYALSILTLGGLFYFNYSDVGLSQAIRMLWKL